MQPLVLTCAGVWTLMGRCDPDDPEDPCLELANPSVFSESMWLAWGIFFDPGTQTGLPEDGRVGGKTKKMHVLLFVFHARVWAVGEI